MKKETDGKIENETLNSMIPIWKKKQKDVKSSEYNDFYTDKEQGSMPYGRIVFAICKMFEQSIQKDIEEGFTKSIVDSKERAKEYRRDHGMGMHM